MNRRRLSLQREVLQELTASDLGSVAGGVSGKLCPGTVGICAADTMYSCLTYISCAMLHTCWAPETLLCLQTD